MRVGEHHYVSISFMFFLNVCVCVCVIFRPPTLPSPFSWGDYGYDGYGYDDGYGGSLRTGWNVIEQLFLHFSLFFASSVFWETMMVKFMFVISSCLQYVVVVLVLDNILVIVVVGVAVIDFLPPAFAAQPPVTCAIPHRLQWSLCRRGSRQVEMPTTTVVSIGKARLKAMIPKDPDMGVS